MSDEVKHVTPLATWDSQDAVARSEGKLVWWTRLDGRYQVEVQRIRDGEVVEDPYQGTLVVFDRRKTMKTILVEPVGLSYGAPFGPDAGDVAYWQDRVLKFIDEEYGS